MEYTTPISPKFGGEAELLGDLEVTGRYWEILRDWQVLGDLEVTGRYWEILR